MSRLLSGTAGIDITPADPTPLFTLWRDASLTAVKMEMSEGEMGVRLVAEMRRYERHPQENKDLVIWRIWI